MINDIPKKTPEVLTQLKELLLSKIDNQNVKVYLLGSWAKNINKHSTDIDIAIFHPDSPGPEFFMYLRELLEESTIPYRVDIIDLVHADPVLLEKVQKESILWSDSKNVSK